jgi:hypothetical protein
VQGEARRAAAFGFDVGRPNSEFSAGRGRKRKGDRPATGKIAAGPEEKKGEESGPRGNEEKAGRPAGRMWAAGPK